MSSHRKEILKLSDHGVVTGEAMIAYLRNELSTEDRQELEKLLQEDPFARDAMEGLQGAPNKASLASSLTSVNRKVRERSGAKEKKQFQLHWTTYAWAAAILGLLVGVGFVLVYVLGENETHVVASNKKVPEEQSPAPVVSPKAETPVAKDSLAVTTQKGGTYTVTVNDNTSGATAPLSLSAAAGSGSKSADAGKAVANKPATTPAGNIATKMNSSLTASASSARAVSTNNGATIFSAAPADKRRTEMEVNKSVVAAKPGLVNFKSTNDSTVALSTGKGAFGSIDGAMQNFYSGDYKTAANSFDAVLKTDPDNPQALYFGGISDYINGQTAKSEASFDKILKKGTIFIDGAKWYKANILLKKGDRDRAKALLLDLSNSNSSYKERAVKKLAELNF